jgi:crossover junction endodeoxyribonuclease RuvC
MIILGIDPGSRRLGYGVIAHSGITDMLIEAGVLGMKGRDDIASLKEIKEGLDAVIKKHRPDYISIEKLFFSKNQKTAMAVAQARGIAIAATLHANIRIVELSPNEIKIGVTGYGHADKKAVSKMVRFILREPELAVIDDASDALAAALCAASRIGRRP